MEEEEDEKREETRKGEESYSVERRSKWEFVESGRERQKEGERGKRV